MCTLIDKFDEHDGQWALGGGGGTCLGRKTGVREEEGRLCSSITEASACLMSEPLSCGLCFFVAGLLALNIACTCRRWGSSFVSGMEMKA